MASSESKDQIKELRSLTDKTIKEAEDVIHEIFPRKAIEMDRLLKSDWSSVIKGEVSAADLVVPLAPKIDIEQSKDDTSEPAEKRQKLSEKATPVVPCNKMISDMIDVLDPALRELISHTNKLQMWIDIITPKIEDGNNFGVMVQEEASREIRQVGGDAFNQLEQFKDYFYSRGKMACDVGRDPHIEDYRKNICQLDRTQLLHVKNTMEFLRHSYLHLYNHITKNLSKIEKPRTSAETERFFM